MQPTGGTKPGIHDHEACLKHNPDSDRQNHEARLADDGIRRDPESDQVPANFERAAAAP